MKSTLLALHAQTSIHAGSGQSDSVIDLPVQRESHTGYPCIFGSSMKGALRAHAEKRAQNLDGGTIADLFGKEGDGSNGNAGSVLVSDARLLLLPIRSLTGQFRWVTCPTVLRRFQQDAKRFGQAVELSIPEVTSEQALTVNEENTIIYLEEYRFNCVTGIDDAWIAELAKFIDYDDARGMLESQLAVINDNNFAYLAKYTLPVNPHIALDSETKTTKNGALWYEETLSSDSILYVGIAVDDVRREGGKKFEQVMEEFQKLFTEQSWLQVGGNETVGMGWFGVRVFETAQQGDQ